MVEEPYAPLRDGTQAVIRLTSLSGIANRYIALTPAPGDAKELDEGATITTESTTDVVDLDQIFNTLDEQTRDDLAGVIKGFATQYEGKGEQAGQSAKYFNPLLSSSRRLVQEVTEDEAALTEFLVNSSRAVTTIAERRDDLSQLVGNANATASAIGAENIALARALGLLPTTLRRANTTFVNLRATLDDLDVLVAESKPATKDLAPFLRELRPLVAGRAADDPRPAHGRAPARRRQRPRRGHAQDAVAPARRHARLPQRPPGAREGSAGAGVRAAVHARLHRLGPRLRPGRRNYDANGHFARIQPIFNAFSVRRQPGRRPAHPDPARAAARRRSRPASCAAARAPPRSGRPTARPRSPTAASTATRASCSPAHETRRRRHPPDRRGRRVRGRRPGRG